MEEEKKPRRNWKWIEGFVDSEGEHIKITYRDDSIPVALVAPRGKRAFTVQFVLRDDPSTTDLYQKIFEETRKELDFYLIEKGEENPWAYAIYHCSTAANMYSRVHWGYYPKGYKDWLSEIFEQKSQNMQKPGNVIWDYRKKIIIDKNNPILAFKACRDRYSSIQGELAGMPYLGSNASEDALTWNVFLTLYEAKKLAHVFRDYKFGRIRALALWGLTPDTKHWNKHFQFEIGHALRSFDGKFAGQMSEPDVAILGSNGLCVIECKLGYQNKPLSHLWEGSMESINKRLPIYLKKFGQFNEYQNEKSVFYYQLIRMAFYAMVLAEKYEVTPHLVILMNEKNWRVKFGRERVSPEDVWADFCNITQKIFPGLKLNSFFWQNLIEIPEVRKLNKLYCLLSHHSCLVG